MISLSMSLSKNFFFALMGRLGGRLPLWGTSFKKEAKLEPEMNNK
jgi:hypothetical protein